jgi:hypothetical protein
MQRALSRGKYCRPAGGGAWEKIPKKKIAFRTFGRYGAPAFADRTGGNLSPQCVLIRIMIASGWRVRSGTRRGPRRMDRVCGGR